jgi:hypothetical protein
MLQLLVLAAGYLCFLIERGEDDPLEQIQEVAADLLFVKLNVSVFRQRRSICCWDVKILNLKTLSHNERFTIFFLKLELKIRSLFFSHRFRGRGCII